ncbi:hypothetical protein F4604DRAFT_1931044 [Suillus subluteus]|nr:hypothetical protein F4604DRAFT_1931044 [Suillus subluteus]
MPGPQRAKGVSRSLNIRTVGSYQRAATARTLRQSDVTHERTAAQARYRLDTTGLTDETIHALNDMRYEAPPDDCHMFLDNNELDHNAGVDWQDVPEELQSDQAFVQAIHDFTNTP